MVIFFVKLRKPVIFALSRFTKQLKALRNISVKNKPKKQKKKKIVKDSTANRVHNN